MTYIFIISIIFFSLNTYAAEFDFYVFVCEWAGTTCKLNDCDQDQGASQDFWNIHGLWPSDGSVGPNFCTDEKFDSSKIASLSKDMNQYWSGLYASAEGFHEHEWTKHGTCSNKTQLDFFTLVLAVATRLDVYSGLAHNGITPGNSYDCADIEKAIKEQYGVSNFSLQADSGYLSAIEICMDANLDLRDCPFNDICTGEVNYPQFKVRSILD